MAIKKPTLVFAFIVLLGLALMYFKFKPSNIRNSIGEIDKRIQADAKEPDTSALMTTKISDQSYDLYGEIKEFMNKQTEYVMGI